MTGSDRLGGWAATILLLCCMAWGFNQVAIKISLAGVSPLLGAGLRSLIAAVLLWAWCRLRGEPLLTRDGTWGYGVLIGLLFAAEFVFIYGGLAYTTASRSVIFLYSAPFFVALGAHVFIPEERLTWTRAAGLVVAFVGLCLAFVDGLHLPSRRELLGDGLELAGGLVWGASTVIVKARRDARLTPQRTLFYQLSISAVALTGFSVLVGERGVIALTLPVAAAIGYQAVIVAFVSYLVWFWLLARHPASGLAAFSFWTPLFGVLAGWLVLGDRLTGNLGAAAVLVAAGIYLVNRRARAGPSPYPLPRWGRG
ncbi:MAG TPA: DMT family transporter [Methylomirabilota bacterium]|nr:DMT family transporter [Methylomirabilota bacterium]